MNSNGIYLDWVWSCFIRLQPPAPAIVASLCSGHLLRSGTPQAWGCLGFMLKKLQILARNLCCLQPRAIWNLKSCGEGGGSFSRKRHPTKGSTFLKCSKPRARSEWEEHILEAFKSYSGFDPKPAMGKASKKAGTSLDPSKGTLSSSKVERDATNALENSALEKGRSIDRFCAGIVRNCRMVIQLWSSGNPSDPSDAKTNQRVEDLHDVRNQGNASSHSTRNRQRSDEPSIINSHIERCQTAPGPAATFLPIRQSLAKTKSQRGQAMAHRRL